MKYLVHIFRTDSDEGQSSIMLFLVMTPNLKHEDRTPKEGFILGFVSHDALKLALTHAEMPDGEFAAISQAGSLALEKPNQMHRLGYIEFSSQQLERLGFNGLASLAKSFGES